MARKTAAVTLANEHFECARMKAVLTRAACARSHQLASIAWPKIGREAIGTAAVERCRGCAIGAEHRSGVSRVPSVQLVPVHAVKVAPRRWCLACGRQLPTERGRKSYCSLACYADGRRLAHIERAAEVEVSL